MAKTHSNGYVYDKLLKMKKKNPWFWKNPMAFGFGCCQA